jgi:hypothetical protein
VGKRILRTLGKTHSETRPGTATTARRSANACPLQTPADPNHHAEIRNPSEDPQPTNRATRINAPQPALLHGIAEGSRARLATARNVRPGGRGTRGCA